MKKERVSPGQAMIENQRKKKKERKKREGGESERRDGWEWGDQKKKEKRGASGQD